VSAVIFDMDGVLVDSEPLWHECEVGVFGELGVELTEEQCRETTGLRTDEVIAHRYALHPWEGATHDEVGARIVERMVALVRERATPMDGVADALAFVRAKGVAVALASSSPTALIDAVVEKLGLEFDEVVSAEDEEYGKPHPAVYLTAARRLDVAPTACLAIEDSLNGVVAAKAARMRVVAVPEREEPAFAVADAVISSLRGLDDVLWSRLNA
jgi:sugar-phosphatase